MTRIIDLFCGAGGAAMGLHDAMPEAHILGYDIRPQPRYPFEFRQTDVTTLSSDDLVKADLVWASPPCQCYSVATALVRKTGRKQYPDLIPATRDLLVSAKHPFVIENVPSAPIRHDLMLCGAMFHLPIIRHRYFEIDGFTVRQPPHLPHNYRFHSVVNGYNKRTIMHRREYTRTKANWAFAMQIDWMTKKELAEAVPTAYSAYIGRCFMARHDTLERKEAGR